MSDVYSVYVKRKGFRNGEELLLYATNVFDQNTTVVNPKGTFELNKAGSLEFDIYPMHPRYDDLAQRKSWVIIYRNQNEYWRGRVLSIEKSFMNIKHVYVEGMLAVLNDSIILPGTNYRGLGVHEMFDSMVANHNSQMLESNGSECSETRFTRGTCQLSDTVGQLKKEFTEARGTLDYIMSEIVDVLGGQIKVVGQDLQYINNPTTISDHPATLKFGESITDLTQKIDAESVITCLYPYGKSTDDVPLTIGSVNGNVDYIQNDEAVNILGRIVGYQTWSDIEDASTLLSTAQEYLNGVIGMALTIEIKGIDLKLIYDSATPIELGQMVKVVSKPHGIDYGYICSKIELDLQNPENSIYTFGFTGTTLTGLNSATEKAVQNGSSSRTSGGSSSGSGGASILPYDETPAIINNSGSAGSSLEYSRGDHKHPVSSYVNPSGYSYGTTQTYMYPLISKNKSGISYVYSDNDFAVRSQNGTTSVLGYTELMLGNSTESGTAGNKYGRLRIYDKSKWPIYIVPPGGLTASKTLTLPEDTGTLALTSDLSLGPSYTQSGTLTTTSYGDPSSGASLTISNPGWYFVSARLERGSSNSSSATTTYPVLFKMKTENNEIISSASLPKVSHENDAITLYGLLQVSESETVHVAAWTGTANVSFSEYIKAVRIGNA